jgi:predicted nucleic acid-binding protein
MPVKPIITNNTPLVALWTLGHLPLLHDLFGEVWVPEAVCAEFMAVEPALRQETLASSPWIRCITLQNPHRVAVFIGLDQGEAEVLALAEAYPPRLVIMDELRGRRYAQRLGLPLTGTLGVLLLAKERGLIPALAPLVETLVAKGLYLAPDLVTRVLTLAGEA